MAPGAVGEVAFALARPTHAIFGVSRAVDRDAAAVPSARCIACHAAAFAGPIQSNGIRIAHATCAVDASCTDCHSTIAHGKAVQWVRSYDMDACIACHAKSGNLACDLCHKGRREVERVKFAGFSATHGPNWKSTHGMGDFATCTVCHKAPDCAKCHGSGVPHEAEFVQVHASYAVKTDAKCSSCHKTSFCDTCHGTTMPHPAGFVESHPAAAKKQRDMCDRCHSKTDCETCHAKHVHPGGSVGGTLPKAGGQR